MIKNEDAQLIHGDCLDVLKEMPDNSVDSIVTDPPYGLSFMGKKWDYDVPDQAIWEECLRVLKPGGHLLAFAGTRTQHRMAARIEDAGFEIRDMIAWVYSTGFPKSMNIDRLKGDKICGCAEPDTHNDGTKKKTEHMLRPLPEANLSTTFDYCEKQREVLQQGVQEQGAPVEERKQFSTAEIWRGQSRMEGWSDAQKASRELCASEVCTCAGMGEGNGAERRVYYGAPSGDGAVVRTDVNTDGVCASHQSQSAGQQTREFGTMAGQPQPQTMGAWQTCGHCGKPVVQSGLGTALKPALEPITVARKPFKGTVAANVLEWGTGAINVDGCRVGEEGGTAKGSKPQGAGNGIYGAGLHGACEIKQLHAGRWPANLIHDGSYETTELLGGAERFFYCAKTSRKDRGEGNTHPTVKPTDLMAYLCRLVTPPGGVVLDPFMGSGSTGKAAVREGFRFIGIEMDADYLAIAEARIAHEAGK